MQRSAVLLSLSDPVAPLANGSAAAAAGAATDALKVSGTVLSVARGHLRVVVESEASSAGMQALIAAGGMNPALETRFENVSTLWPLRTSGCDACGWWSSPRKEQRYHAGADGRR